MAKNNETSWLSHAVPFIIVFGLVFFGLIYTLRDVYYAQDDFQARLTRVEIEPKAYAGEDKEYKVGETVLLDGSASYDPDGEITAFQWRAQAENPKIVLPPNTDSEQITFPAEIVGNYRFFLTVTDNSDLTSADDIVITIVSPE